MAVVYRGALIAAEDRSDFDRQSPHTAAEQIVLRHGHALPAATSSATVTAVVNHGRWLAPCPWCASAQLASRKDKRFFCVECLNAPGGGQWATVVWPAQADEIAAVLSMRPNKSTRSWLAHETLGDLLRENETYGVI